jgi:hypothetical protein
LTRRAAQKPRGKAGAGEPSASASKGKPPTVSAESNTKAKAKSKSAAASGKSRAPAAVPHSDPAGPTKANPSAVKTPPAKKAKHTDRETAGQSAPPQPAEQTPPKSAATQDSESFPDYYKTLGIPRGAGSKDIHGAYRRLAKVCHPDKGVREIPMISCQVIAAIIRKSTMCAPDCRIGNSSTAVGSRERPDSVWTPIRSTGANGGMGSPWERPDSVVTPIRSTGANGGMGSPGERPDSVWTPIRSTGANGGMGSPRERPGHVK